MRASLSTKRLAIVAVAIAAILFPAFAAETGTLSISGSVAKKVSITVTGTANTNISFENGLTDYQIATFTAVSNSRAGYTIKIQSTNLGKLVGEVSPASSFGYSLSYGLTATSLTQVDPTSFATAAGASFVPETDKTSGTMEILAISCPAPTNVYADNYSDSLTFTISAN